MRSDLREYEILRGIDSRISDLQNAQDRGIRELLTDLRLHIQETRFHLASVEDRLGKLEEKAGKPMINWQSLIQSIWFKVILLIALATGNTQLIEVVTAALK